uniref:Uncharacterized protein n=1 Tax=Dulem virus 32 TaxID=3145750 RepID=A0AAU8B0N4_9CAUD
MASDRRYINQRTGEVVDNIDVRPFREILAELGEGSTEQELSEAMWDLLQRVQDTGKQGTVTLAITVAPNGAGRIEVKDEVKLKLPEYARPATAFYLDKQGNATRRNPDQPEIPGVTHIATQHSSRKEI